MEKIIKVATDFSEHTGLRYCKLSDDSGELFYHTVLNKAFKEVLDKKGMLIVDLDDTLGYAHSFLDEVFGNLVFDFKLENVEKHLKIISNQEESWEKTITEETYVKWENRRKENDEPKKTEEHEEWYRFYKDELQLKKWSS